MGQLRKWAHVPRMLAREAAAATLERGVEARRLRRDPKFRDEVRPFAIAVATRCYHRRGYWSRARQAAAAAAARCGGLGGE